MAKKSDAKPYNFYSPAASLFIMAREAILEDEYMLSMLSSADRKELIEIIKNRNHPVQIEARRLDDERHRKNFPIKEISIIEVICLTALALVILSVFFVLLL